MAADTSTPPKPRSRGFLGGLFGSRGKTKVASLGEANNFYYNEKLKRWVERGKEEEAEAEAFPPPPPKSFTAGSRPTSSNSLMNHAESQDDSVIAQPSQHHRRNSSDCTEGPSLATVSAPATGLPKSRSQRSLSSRYVPVGFGSNEAAGRSNGSLDKLMTAPAAVAPPAKFFVPGASVAPTSADEVSIGSATSGRRVSAPGSVYSSLKPTTNGNIDHSSAGAEANGKSGSSSDVTLNPFMPPTTFGSAPSAGPMYAAFSSKNKSALGDIPEPEPAAQAPAEPAPGASQPAEPAIGLDAPTPLPNTTNPAASWGSETTATTLNGFVDPEGPSTAESAIIPDPERAGASADSTEPAPREHTSDPGLLHEPTPAADHQQPTPDPCTEQPAADPASTQYTTDAAAYSSGAEQYAASGQQYSIEELQQWVAAYPVVDWSTWGAYENWTEQHLSYYNYSTFYQQQLAQAMAAAAGDGSMPAGTTQVAAASVVAEPATAVEAPAAEASEAVEQVAEGAVGLTLPLMEVEAAAPTVEEPAVPVAVEAAAAADVQQLHAGFADMVEAVEGGEAADDLLPELPAPSSPVMAKRQSLLQDNISIGSEVPELPEPPKPSLASSKPPTTVHLTATTTTTLPAPPSDVQAPADTDGMAALFSMADVRLKKRLPWESSDDEEDSPPSRAASPTHPTPKPRNLASSFLATTHVLPKDGSGQMSILANQALHAVEHLANGFRATAEKLGVEKGKGSGVLASWLPQAGQADDELSNWHERSANLFLDPKACQAMDDLLLNPSGVDAATAASAAKEAAAELQPELGQQQQQQQGQEQEQLLEQEAEAAAAAVTPHAPPAYPFPLDPIDESILISPPPSSSSGADTPTDTPRASEPHTSPQPSTPKQPQSPRPAAPTHPAPATPRDDPHPYPKKPFANPSATTAPLAAESSETNSAVSDETNFLGGRAGDHTDDEESSVLATALALHQIHSAPAPSTPAPTPPAPAATHPDEPSAPSTSAAVAAPAAIDQAAPLISQLQAVIASSGLNTRTLQDILAILADQVVLAQSAAVHPPHDPAAAGPSTYASAALPPPPSSAPPTVLEAQVLSMVGFRQRVELLEAQQRTQEALRAASQAAAQQLLQAEVEPHAELEELRARVEGVAQAVAPGAQRLRPSGRELGVDSPTAPGTPSSRDNRGAMVEEVGGRVSHGEIEAMEEAGPSGGNDQVPEGGLSAEDADDLLCALAAEEQKVQALAKIAMGYGASEEELQEAMDAVDAEMIMASGGGGGEEVEEEQEGGAVGDDADALC